MYKSSNRPMFMSYRSAQDVIAITNKSCYILVILFVKRQSKQKKKSCIIVIIIPYFSLI